MKSKRAASAAKAALTLVGVIAIVAGCHKVTGGGWITGVNGGKATFGFQAQCRSGTAEIDFGGGPITLPELSFYEGQFQYHDKGANVSFHGKAMPNNFLLGFPGSCDDLVAEMVANGIPTNETSFSGECVSRPGGATGTFEVTVVDNGKPGLGAGDEITVTTPRLNFFGEPLGAPCTADGQPYSNSGLLGGGNIAMPGHKS